MMHHLVQTLTSWRTPMKKHHIWCSLNANLQWPLGGNLDPTCIGFLSFISFSNNRTMQDSLIDHRDALLFDSKFPLVLFIPVIYLKSVTTHQFLKRRAQCRTLPVCLWNVRIWGQNLLSHDEVVDLKPSSPGIFFFILPIGVMETKFQW
jgi:hypothetical protein